MTLSVVLVVTAWYRYDMDSIVGSVDSNEIGVGVDHRQTERFPKSVGNGDNVGFQAPSTAGTTLHLRTASVIKFSNAGSDQHPMGDVVVIVAVAVAMISVGIGDGVSETYVSHFGDCNTKRSCGDMVSKTSTRNEQRE
jgi:hypothetical protein